jgi:hypothetical protein
MGPLDLGLNGERPLCLAFMFFDLNSNYVQVSVLIKTVPELCTLKGIVLQVNVKWFSKLD